MLVNTIDLNKICIFLYLKNYNFILNNQNDFFYFNLTFWDLQIENDYPQLLLNAIYWHSPFQNVKNEKLYGFYGRPLHLSIILIKKLSHI